MSSQEVRTVSSTGGAKGVKEERFSLMPRAGLAWISRVFGFGAKKYADHNWRKGYEWSKSFDALERHFQAAKDGETYDEESGLPHLAHAGFHILVLLTWLDEQGEGPNNLFDDRWPHSLARARVLEAYDADPHGYESGARSLYALLERFGLSEDTFDKVLEARKPEWVELEKEIPKLAFTPGSVFTWRDPEPTTEAGIREAQAAIQASFDQAHSGHFPPRLEM